MDPLSQKSFEQLVYLVLRQAIVSCRIASRFIYMYPGIHSGHLENVEDISHPVKGFGLWFGRRSYIGEKCVKIGLRKSLSHTCPFKAKKPHINDYRQKLKK